MKIITLVEHFQKHCELAKSKLIKQQMMDALGAGICPFRCQYCLKRKENCSSCIVLDFKETDEYKQCQQLIKRNPDILKMLQPVLRGISWSQPNLRGGF